MVNKLNFTFFLLRPLGFLYGIIMRLRSYLYGKGIIPSHSLGIPVISVGNLTVGGSGKTPMVLYLSRLMLENSMKVCVVSRGYGGSTKESVNIVSDGTNILLTADVCGDEPRMIAENIPSLRVVTGKKRVHPCRYAEQTLGADIIILDDGFQHMAVKRDLNLVLFNSTTLFHHFHVLPGGLLREGFSALHRADAICITGNSEHNKKALSRFETWIRDRFPHLRVFTFDSKPVYFTDKSGQHVHLESFEKSCFAFCGIASPERFAQTLADISVHSVGFKSFPDHKSYNEKLIKQMDKEAQRLGADCLLTTEKDLVKLMDYDTTTPVYALAIGIPENHQFNQFLLEHLNGAMG